MADRSGHRLIVTTRTGPRRVTVAGRPDGDDDAMAVTVGDDPARRTRVETTDEPGAYRVVIDGGARLVRVARAGRTLLAMADGEAFEVADDHDGGRAATTVADADALAAPMPATVTAILVEPGATVAAGDTLVRLEAMKMELAIRAPVSGRVATIDCREGDLVQPGRPLVTVTPSP